MWSSQSLLQSRHLVVQRQPRHESVPLWQCRFGMLDARQNVERVHVVDVLHSKFVRCRHLLGRGWRQIFSKLHFEESGEFFVL